MKEAGTAIPISESLEVLVNQFHERPDTDLFLSPEFFKLHQAAGLRSYFFQLRDKRSRTILANSPFWEEEPGVFASPAKGPFGGFDFGNDLSLSRVESFIERVGLFLADAGARQIRITDHPLCYNLGKSSLVFNILLRQGYKVGNHELSYWISVGRDPLISKMDRGNAKRLGKCQRENLSARRLKPEEHLSAYEIIAENRVRRGFPVTMSFQQLQAMIGAFPSQVHFFGAFRLDQMLASSVCISVNSRVLYVFYWGDRAEARILSPTTFLADHIYRFAQERKYQLLDVGTATVQSEPNSGLIRYKKNLGCEESLKFTLHRS